MTPSQFAAKIQYNVGILLAPCFDWLHNNAARFLIQTLSVED